MKAAHEAYKARDHTGNTSERDLAGVVRNQLVMNCDITPRALSNATGFFGFHFLGVRGNSDENARKSHYRENTNP